MMKEALFVNETGKMVKPVAEFLEYKIRSGRISAKGGDKIWRLVLKNPEKADAFMDILDMELPEEEAIRRVEKLIQQI